MSADGDAPRGPPHLPPKLRGYPRGGVLGQGPKALGVDQQEAGLSGRFTLFCKLAVPPILHCHSTPLDPLREKVTRLRVHLAANASKNFHLPSLENKAMFKTIVSSYI